MSSTEKLLAELNLDASSHTRCSSLSVGARQMIEIAQAISRGEAFDPRRAHERFE